MKTQHTNLRQGLSVTIRVHPCIRVRLLPLLLVLGLAEC
jgi:hypothetical protein